MWVLHKGEDWVTLSVPFLRRARWGFHTPWSVFSLCLAPKPCGWLQHSSHCALSSRSVHIHKHLQLNPLFPMYSFFFNSCFDSPVESPNLAYFIIMHMVPRSLRSMTFIFICNYWKEFDYSYKEVSLHVVKCEQQVMPVHTWIANVYHKLPRMLRGYYWSK